MSFLLWIIGAVQAPAIPPAAATFIHEELKLTRYQAAAADLNGDRRVEVIVRATDPDRCGSGGCTLFVLTPARRGYRIVTRMSITQLPVRLLPSSTHGWRDIGVRVSGGGITRPRDVRLRFDRRSYPTNPSMVGAVAGSAAGRILIH